MEAAAQRTAGFTAAALGQGEVQCETAAALRELCGRSALVVSLAVPLDARRLLCSGNLLEGGPLCSCAMPVWGTAAGGAALAAEPAVFDITSSQRLQDLQLLNLRYHGASFLCVPIPGHDKPGLTTAAAAAAPAATKTVMATSSSPDPAACGCLTLGFAHDVRQQLPSMLLHATALAAALAPLLPHAAAATRARHITSGDSSSSSSAGGSGSLDATQLWRQNSAASETQPLPAHLIVECGFSHGDSATAAEVNALLQDGDSWLYDSSCDSSQDGDAVAPAAKVNGSTAALPGKADGDAAVPVNATPCAQSTVANGPPALKLSPFQAVSAARRSASGNAAAAAAADCSQQHTSTASRRRISREDSRRLVDQALDDLAAADLATAADAVQSPAFGVAHTGTDFMSSGTSSLISMPSLQTDSVDSLFSRPSCGGGAFAITLPGIGGGSASGIPLEEWPLAARLAVALPAASPAASTNGSPQVAKPRRFKQRSGNTPLSLAGSPAPLVSSPSTAAAGGTSRRSRQAVTAGDDSSGSRSAEAALEAEIWAAEGPAMAALRRGTAATRAPPAEAEAEEAAEAAPQGWLQRMDLGFGDPAMEAQYVRWHGTQAQKLDCTALAILLVMWVALGLPPMGLFWHATPGWAMWALGALWVLAAVAQQLCPTGYLRHREGVLQAVHFLSLTFGCLNTRFCAQVAARKLGSADGALQLASALGWLQRALLVEATAFFPLLLWVRVRRAAPLQLAILAMVLATLPRTCASCFAAGTAACQLCHAAGALLLVVFGTAAPLAFMWRTERHSRRTFAWRLRAKGCDTVLSQDSGSGSGAALAAGH